MRASVRWAPGGCVAGEVVCNAHGENTTHNAHNTISILITNHPHSQKHTHTQ